MKSSIYKKLVDCCESNDLNLIMSEEECRGVGVHYKADFRCDICGFVFSRCISGVMYRGTTRCPRCLDGKYLYENFVSLCRKNGLEVIDGEDSFYEERSDGDYSYLNFRCLFCGHEFERGMSQIVDSKQFGCNECSDFYSQVRHKDYEVDDDYFSDIDNDHKSYWIGFLLADGCIGTKDNIISLELGHRDWDHVVAFKDDVSCTKSLSEHGRGVVLSFSSVKMKNDLISLGVKPRKSGVGVDVFGLLSCVPDELVVHFLRGIVDGDGSVDYFDGYGCGIGSQGLRLHGHVSIISAFEDVLVDKFGIVGGNHNRGDYRIYDDRRGYDDDYRSFVLHGSESVDVLNWLYVGSDIYLSRKYDDAMAVINEYG